LKIVERRKGAAQVPQAVRARLRSEVRWKGLTKPCIIGTEFSPTPMVVTLIDPVSSLPCRARAEANDEPRACRMSRSVSCPGIDDHYACARKVFFVVRYER
jgi:hypothetical protein